MNDNNEWKIKLEDYYGPFNVILDLIQKNHMAILKFDISKITEQYVEFVNNLLKKSLTQRSLDEISDYLNMAQYLISLKSKFILRQQYENQYENRIDEWDKKKFTELLLEVQKYKEVMVLLNEKQNERVLMFSKNPDDFSRFIPDNFNYEKLPNKIDPKIFLNYLEEIRELEEIENNSTTYEVVNIPVNQVIALILNNLEINIYVEFVTLFKKLYSKKKLIKYYFVTFFLSVLILNSQNKIELTVRDSDKLFLRLIED